MSRISVAELLKDAPRNWGRWGPDDEVGALNYLDAATVLAAARTIRQGKVFTLQTPMARPAGDPVVPARQGAQRYMVRDKASYSSGREEPFAGGMEYADDVMFCYLQGSTQYDALGHVWYDDALWNGYPADTTVGGLRKASVLPIAERGVAGRGVLLDVARWRGKEVLDPGEAITLADLNACAQAQGVELRPRDVLVIRTGWIGWYYRVGEEEFHRDPREPGLTYSRELVDWFAEREIPNLVTDTMANEVESDPGSGVVYPLHAALLRNLGVSLTETALLEKLAEDCAADGQYDFFYVAAPLKIVEGAGAPVNPVVVK